MTGEAELEITVKGTQEKLLAVLEKIGEIEESRLETVSEEQTKAVIKPERMWISGNLFSIF